MILFGLQEMCGFNQNVLEFSFINSSSATSNEIRQFSYTIKQKWLQSTEYIRAPILRSEHTISHPWP